MKTVLAALDSSAAAEPVVRTGKAAAELLDARIVALHVTEDGATTVEAVTERADVPLVTRRGQVIGEVVAAARGPDTVLVVVGARRDPTGRRPAGHVALAVLQAVARPVLVVPPETPVPRLGDRRLRVLVPLEGSEETSGAVAEALHVLAAADAELVVVHVFDAATAVPAFWDQAGHAEQSWGSAFVARWCAEAGVDLHLRRGAAPTEIASMLEGERIDLVALSWSRVLTAGRARVIRHLLGCACVPVLLVPRADG